MSIKNVEIQDSTGNVYYPHTDASIVKFGETTVGASLSEKANDIKTILDKNTSNITYFVDNINGNDSDDGLTVSTPFKTIEKAWAQIPLFTNKSYDIKLKTNYSNDVNLTSKILIALNKITISSYSTQITFNGQIFIYGFLGANWLGFTNIAFANNILTYGSNVVLNNCTIIKNLGASLFVANEHSNVFITGCTITNSTSVCIAAISLSKVYLENTTLNGGIGLDSEFGSTIAKGINLINNCTTHEATSNGGVIR